MSKISVLRGLLLAGERVSGKSALEFGYYRLSDGILKLRRSGLNIKTEMVERDGQRFGEYFIEG